MLNSTSSFTVDILKDEISSMTIEIQRKFVSEVSEQISKLITQLKDVTILLPINCGMNLIH